MAFIVIVVNMCNIVVKRNSDHRGRSEKRVQKTPKNTGPANFSVLFVTEETELHLFFSFLLIFQVGDGKRCQNTEEEYFDQ